MDVPTLTVETTTVTLPYPARDGLTRTPVVRGPVRPTIGGRLRRTVTSRAWTYRMTLQRAPVTTYDAVSALIDAAALAGIFPTFLWTGGPWPSADGTGITVDLVLSDQTTPYPDLTLCDFTVELTEEMPR
jgi:hypothetical protein